MVNGLLYINCKTCGLNTSHGTRQHNAYVKNSSSFKLPTTHFYVKECNRLAQGYTGVMKTASGTVTTPPIVLGPAASTCSTTLTIERSKLESMLADYEHNSTNLNALDLSDMMRSLFLNSKGVGRLSTVVVIIWCFYGYDNCFHVNFYVSYVS